MDPKILAQNLVTFLAPFSPYLLKFGDKAIEEAGKKFGDDAWKRAKAMWGRLRPKVEIRPAAQEAIQDVAKSPNDDDARAALRQQLKKLLTEEPAIAAEVTGLLDEAHTKGTIVTVVGNRSVGIGGNLKNSTIITGDHHRIDN